MWGVGMGLLVSGEGLNKRSVSMQLEIKTIGHIYGTLKTIIGCIV